MRRIGPDRISELYVQFARRFGATSGDAELFAECFLYADLHGKDTQGLALLPLAFEDLSRKASRFDVEPEVVREGPGWAIWDGHHGVGHVVAAKAMDLAIRRARDGGVCAVWIRNSNDVGPVSAYAVRAVAQDLVGIATTNGPPCVAPFGGRDPLLAPNPFSIAVPANRRFPIVIDTSGSSISKGKVVLTARAKGRLPEPVMIDENGRLTSDVLPLIEDISNRTSELRGAIAAGGVRGYSFVLFVELFAGLLSGMSTSKDVASSPNEEHPSTQGQFVMAVDVAHLMDIQIFKSRVDDLIDNLKNSRPAEGFSEVMVPGERSQLEAIRRRADGIPVQEEEWSKVVSIAGELGIPIDHIPNLTTLD